MNDTEINIAIAEACGVKPRISGWYAANQPDDGATPFMADTEGQIQKWITSLPNTSQYKHYIPKPCLSYTDYCHDLNAMQEAVRVGLRLIGGKTPRQARTEYLKNLSLVVGGYEHSKAWLMCEALAPQRAKAFLMTANKWKKDTK